MRLRLDDVMVWLAGTALIAGIALAGCGGSADGADLPDLRPLGWGAADTWHTQPIELVDDAAAAGLRFVVTEHFPTVQEPARDWRRGDVLDSFPELARAWNRRACENGQTHVVFLGNWNVVSLRAQPDAWWAEVVNEALSIYDPTCTWIQPLAEPDEGDLEKARRWTQLVADAWPGRIVMPAAGAHWPIRRDFVDRHPASVGEAERWLSTADPRLLVITDGGAFVPIDSARADLPRLAGAALASGVPFIVYADRYAPGNPAAHRGIIQAVGGVP